MFLKVSISSSFGSQLSQEYGWVDRIIVRTQFTEPSCWLLIAEISLSILIVDQEHN